MPDPVLSPVYRAPLRSRDDAVDHTVAVEWALLRGVVGVGGRLSEKPDDLASAQAALSEVDERLAARLGRFAAASTGAFVWTRVPGRDTWLGRVTGAWRFDTSDAARIHDLQHVRACEWLDQPVPEAIVPDAVQQTFARGGRNFQRINPAGVEPATEEIWAEVSAY